MRSRKLFSDSVTRRNVNVPIENCVKFSWEKEYPSVFVRRDVKTNMSSGLGFYRNRIEGVFH